MHIYHDFSYVEYVLNSEADNGLLLYFKCLERINNEIIKVDDDRLWQAFIRSGKKGQTFEDYKASIGYYDKIKEINPYYDDNQNKFLMSNSEKKKEETRIIKNSEELRKIIEAKDKEYELNKVAKLNVEEG